MASKARCCRAAWPVFTHFYPSFGLSERGGGNQQTAVVCIHAQTCAASLKLALFWPPNPLGTSPQLPETSPLKSKREEARVPSPGRAYLVRVMGRSAMAKVHKR